MQRALVSLEKKNRVALIRMTSPETMNALDEDMGPALAGALERAGSDSGIRAVALTGSGDVFSAGGDLARAHEYLDANPGMGAAPVFAGYTVWVQRILELIAGLPKPVVCAVNGAASGAGLGWMLAADFAVVSLEAKLVTGFLAVGLAPGAGVSLTLARLMGAKRAAGLLMLNRVIRPEEAVDWGLAQAAAPPGDVLPLALDFALGLGGNSADALSAGKSLIQRAGHHGLFDQSLAEKKFVLHLADLPEFARRVKRFRRRQEGRAGG